MKTNLLKTRWAAIGAAVAVTLGAGGLGISYATSPAGATAFVPITPCRVVDTRPAPDTVGTRTSPLGPEETYTVTAHGDNGNCTGIPTGATGLSLNVTALGATSGTFLTLWATGATQPTASNLNPQPGQPPTPNAVTTGVSASGQFNIFNKVGSVNVIVDIVGYYTDHQHTGDRHRRRLARCGRHPERRRATHQRSSTAAAGRQHRGHSAAGRRVRRRSKRPVPGTSSIAQPTQLSCQITDGTSAIDGTKVRMLDDRRLERQRWRTHSRRSRRSSVPAYTGLLSSVVSPFNLVCSATDAGDEPFDDITITATYFPSSYGPLTIVIFPNEALPAGTPDGTPGGVVGG